MGISPSGKWDFCYARTDCIYGKRKDLTSWYIPLSLLFSWASTVQILPGLQGSAPPGVSMQICSVCESWDKRVKCLPGAWRGVRGVGSTEAAQTTGSWVTEVSYSLRNWLSLWMWPLTQGPMAGAWSESATILTCSMETWRDTFLLSRVRLGELSKSGKPSPAIPIGP